MTLFLAALLALDAILHAIIVARFGLKGNEPPALFAVLYAVLTVAVGLAVPYALWATLVVVVGGTMGLTASFSRIPHDKTIERVVLALNVIILVLGVWLLFVR